MKWLFIDGEKKIENGQFFNNNMFLYSRKLNDFLIFENMSEFVVF